MSTHKCQFAELIGQDVAWQTDDNGLTVCVYCHAPKDEAVKPVVKTVRK